MFVLEYILMMRILPSLFALLPPCQPRYGAVDPAVFAHPDSRPTFGKCKQCGVDDECPMWECMQ
jgi:hypothetical protein